MELSKDSAVADLVTALDTGRPISNGISVHT